MSQGPPGLILPGTQAPFYFRGLIYGEAKTGKSVFCGTWPAPIFLHTEMESGYDTFRWPPWTGLQGHMFAYGRLGQEHHLWLQSKGKAGRRFTDDFRAWVYWLSQELAAGRCPYQTVVLGAFNAMQQLVISEAELLHGGRRDGQKVWAYVAAWMREVLTTLCALPLHVIFECNAEIRHKDRETGNPTAYVPGLKGQGYGVVLAAVNAVLFQEVDGAGWYWTHLAPVAKAITNVRLAALWTDRPVANCSYDFFAERLGLPPIMTADPSHPRNTPGLWPWQHWHA